MKKNLYEFWKNGGKFLNKPSDTEEKVHKTFGNSLRF